jgi:hypothetical protein
LAERLAAKKAKKERELADQEVRELSELETKQKEEQEERERLRQAKMVWTERLEEAMKRADEMGLSVAQKEDHCLQEIVAKKLVPDTHLNDAVHRIYAQRHAEEMTNLLQAHFDERVGSLRSAVEKVLEEKASARNELQMRLTNENASEDRVREEIAALDTEFNNRQMVAEKKATGALEQLHTKQQMVLRQRQLEEIAKVVGLYTDPESLAKLKSATGKSQIEEMAEYRSRLEQEKKAREEQMQRERHETEAKLREQMAADMERMQQQLAEDQRRAELEFDKRRLEVQKQREELERKQAEERGALDQQEKERILAIFEKEQAAAMEASENERKTQKQKLQDRLAKKKLDKEKGKNSGAGSSSTAASTPPSEAQPADLLQSVAAAQAASDAKAAAKGKKKFDDAAAAWRGHLAAAAARGGSSADLNAAGGGGAIGAQMSLIEQKLERIERLVAAIDNSNNLGGASASPVPGGVRIGGDSFAGTGALPPVLYRDSDEPTPGDAVEIVPEDEIHLQERARLEFGRRLAAMVGLKTLTIRAANSLPPSNAVNNAFSNSYHYGPQEDTLYVHSNRLISSGDFGLVVIHALSHIKVN